MYGEVKFGIMSRIMLIIVFLAGLLMMSNIVFLNEETEFIYGTVVNTYTSRTASGTRAGGSFQGSPKCSVTWYDKDGEQHTNGMPNNNDYEIGDYYLIEVDAETNSYEAKSNGEIIVMFVIGLITCTVSVKIWKAKSNAVKEAKRMVGS